MLDEMTNGLSVFDQDHNLVILVDSLPHIYPDTQMAQ